MIIYFHPVRFVKMIIDFHTHVFPEKTAERAVKSLLECITLPDAVAYCDGTVGGLLASMKRSGVDFSVTMPVVTKPAQFESINNYARSLSDIPGIIPFGGIHPENENIEEKLDFIKSSGLKGIKLHPDYQREFIDSEKYIKIIRYCGEIGLKVLIHAGIDVGIPEPVHCPPRRALKMLRAVEADKREPYIVLAHMGGWKMQSEVREYLCGENVYFDTGYCPDHYEKDELLSLISLHGTDKILFATDSPWGDQKLYIEILESLPLPEDEKEKIFYKNACRLIALKL